VKRLTEPVVAQALEKFAGNIAACARALKVTRSSVYGYIQSRPALVELLQDVREARLDNAESALERAIIAGEAWAVCFTLKTLGKERGYVERTEHRHGGDPDNQTPIPIAREVIIEVPRESLDDGQ
jgi:hypothetical protein